MPELIFGWFPSALVAELCAISCFPAAGLGKGMNLGFRGVGLSIALSYSSDPWELGSRCVGCVRVPSADALGAGFAAAVQWAGWRCLRRTSRNGLSGCAGPAIAFSARSLTISLGALSVRSVRLGFTRNIRNSSSVFAYAASQSPSFRAAGFRAFYAWQF